MIKGVGECEEEWIEALEPPWLSDFSRYFAPLFPEMMDKKWVAFLGEPGPLLLTPFPYFYDTEEQRRLPQFEALEGMINLWSMPWSIFPGEYLIRVANHLEEWDLALYGLSEASYQDSDIREQIESKRDPITLQTQLSSLSELAFVCYEGIWGAFFRSERLLARTFLHCSGRDVIVLETKEGVGPNGDWLGGWQKTCPVFHGIPKRR